MTTTRSWRRIRPSGASIPSNALVSIAVGLILVGCTAGPGTDEKTAADSAVPSAIVGSGEEPITYPPDNMWAFLSTMPGLQNRSKSLAEAVDFAEVVMVGQYVGVERGRQYGSDSTAIALIKVNSVEKGVPDVGSDGFVRVEFVLVVGSPAYPEKQFADLERSIPKDPALLFLFSWKSYFELIDQKIPGWAERTDLGSVYKTIGGDGTMRIVNGAIEPPEYVEGWPTTLAGATIDSVVTDITALASSPTP